MSEWQPIETAPRDEFILVIVAKNEKGDGPFTPDVARISGGFIYLCSSDDVYATFGDDEWPLTHWMPLPEPPDA